MAAVDKKVVAFVGSARKKHTHNTVQQHMRNLQAPGDIECEIVPLGQYTYDRDHVWVESG